MTSTHQQKSVLPSLRSVIPIRNASFTEALKVAELQACKLSELIGTTDGIRESDISTMPRIMVTRECIPVSGTSHWNGQTWVIVIAKRDSPARQRFTLLHEFKHIIDHGSCARLYQGNRTHTAAQQAEMAADYFAGCALVSKRQLKSAWGNRIQRVSALADHFGVSQQAIRVRLAQTGLNTVDVRPPSARCARPVWTPRSKAQRFRPAVPTTERGMY